MISTLSPRHYAKLLLEISGISDRDKQQTQLQQLAKWLLRHHHTSWLPRIERAYNILQKQRQGVQDIELHVPFDLNDGERQQISQTLSDQLKSPVDLDVKVDARLIGGFRLRINDDLYDDSFRQKLQQLRTRLTGRLTT